MLFATGYLTDASKPVNGVHRLVIPNREIRGIYEKIIRSWFRMRVTGDTSRWKQFCEAIKAGEYKEVEQLFNEFLVISISNNQRYVRKKRNEGELLSWHAFRIIAGRRKLERHIECGIGDRIHGYPAGGSDIEGGMCN